MATKMKFDIDYLLKEKLIGKIPPSKQKAEESIKTAYSWIEESKKNFANDLFKSCILTSYLGMFHAARAILFFDGFREKSHFGVARYLETKYVKKGILESRWIRLLDYYRDFRHQDQYRTSFFVSKEDAKNSLETASQFIERIKKLFRTISST